MIKREPGPRGRIPQKTLRIRSSGKRYVVVLEQLRSHALKDLLPSLGPYRGVVRILEICGVHAGFDEKLGYLALRRSPGA